MKNILAGLCLSVLLAIASVAQAATVLVTGSNRGLGLEFVRQYAADGWTVIATARNLGDADELKALAAKHKNIQLKTLDVIDVASLKALAQDLKGVPIDVLINNAGVLGAKADQRMGALSHEAFDQVMGVNTFAPLAISDALLENVAASEQKKIIAITSGSGQLAPGGGGNEIYFYNASKAALNMVMRRFAFDVRPRGVIIGLIAPGAVDTDMRREVVGDAAARDLRPEQSIGGMRQVIERLSMAKSGAFLNYDGREVPW